MTNEMSTSLSSWQLSAGDEGKPVAIGLEVVE